MLDRVAVACARKRGTVILIVALVSLFMAYGVVNLKQTSDYKKFLSSEEASVRVTLKVAEEFRGLSFETALVEGENLLKAGNLREILRLENLLLSSPELENKIIGCQSYADILLQQLPQVKESLQNPSLDPMTENLVMGAYLTFLSDPQLSKRIRSYLTPDLNAGLMNIYLNPSLPKEEKSKAVEAARGKLATAKNFSVGLAGSYTMEKDIRKTMDRDNRVLIPATIVFVLVVLFLTFRRFSDVGRCLLVVGLATLWTMGVMGFTGSDFTAIHVALVPICMVAGIDYSLYFLSRYYEEKGKGKGIEESLSISASRVGTAVMMCFLTTVIGFLSFSISDLPPVKSLGQFAALAVSFSFLLALTLLPALAGHGGTPKSEVGQPRGRKVEVSRGLASLGRGIARHGKAVIVVLAVTLALSASVAPRVSSTMSFDILLPSNVESLRTSHRIENLFGGQNQLFVLACGDILNPLALQQLRSLQQGVMSDNEGLGLIGGGYSLADLVFQYALFSGHMPQTREEVAGILENLRLSNQDVSLPLSDNSTVIIFNVLGRTDRDFKRATQLVRKYVENFSSSLLTLRLDGKPAVGGGPAVIADLFSRIFPNMQKTTVLALILSFLVLILLFRSPVLGTLTILPVSMVILWELGTFYLLGWSLDVFTLGTFSLMIGMGIDYSVQLSSRMREELEKGEPPEEAAAKATASIGKAVLASAVTMGGGFLVLSLSRMPAMSRFGKLVALVIFYAFIAAILFLPSALGARRKSNPTRS
jgi:hydrophobe/amphiphile efflux-3 (HAE3) family protein